MKILIQYIKYYLFILLILEIYSKFTIGYYHNYSLLDNSIDEYLTILIIYTIFFLILKAKNLIFIPIIFLITYILIDFISSKYNRYLDYSDLVNIPLLFDALLQSKGQIVYLFLLLPIGIVIFIIKSHIVRVYIFALFIISLLFISRYPLRELFIYSYDKLAFSHKNFWSPNKLEFDYDKIGRLSTFFYQGMIKDKNIKKAKLYLGDRESELSTFIKDIKPHIKQRNIYIIGLESFSLPKELTNLKLDYLNSDKNITYNVVGQSSTMITSIFGGGTIQSEFEALCGEPALQQFSAFEFTEFTGSPTNCLPRILQKLQWNTIVSNTYKPQPSFEALKTLGFKDINFPKEYFPNLPSYITNKNKSEGEYAIFDTDLYNQNLKYIQNKYIDKNKTVFNYMFSVWGHAFHDMKSRNRPIKISIKNRDKLSISTTSIRAINQEYYRIIALQKYFDQLKKIDSNALVIAFSDHRPVLDGANSYKKYGLKTDVFHNFIVIMDKGKYIKFKKPFPLYALSDIILNQLTDGWYCKNHICKINTDIRYREKYLSEYYKIMANGMKEYSAKLDNFFITPRQTYYFDNPTIPFKNFSHAETNFRWTKAKEAYINFNIKDINLIKGVIKIDIGTLGKQKISIYLNNHLLVDKIFNSSNIHLTLTFNKKILNLNGVNRLKFKLPDARRPNNGDKRVLAMQFKSFSFF